MSAGKSGTMWWDRSSCGPQLAILRGRFDLSQEELAGRLGVDEKTIRNWESGRTAPNASGRGLLAAALERLDVDWMDPMIKELAIGLGRRNADPPRDRPRLRFPGRIAATFVLPVLVLTSLLFNDRDPSQIIVPSATGMETLPPFPAPRILEPVEDHQARDTKILHAWQAVPGAIFYEVQFLNAPPHTTAIFGDQIRKIDGTSCSFDHQSIHCPIYWQVRAVDASGRRSDWSRSSYFVDCDH